MKKSFLRFIVLLVCVSSVAQKKSKVLFKIDGVPTYVSEFNELFQQNKATLTESDLDKNLQLMVDYKLKLRQASREGLDTLSSIKKELNGYKADLAAPYLTDEETLENLLKEAYDRTVWQLRASHILVSIKDNDTVAALEKVKEIQSRLKKGEDFGTLAVQFSDDPSAKNNKGDLGYFSAFKMVYPFECGAYNTKVGEISKPVKTNYGYHLIKVVDKRKSEGKIKVAHIMLHDLSAAGEKKMEAIYQELENGAAFKDLAKKYSTDRRTKDVGGELRPFSKGDLPKAFEDVAFSIKKENTYSKPFTTAYGRHIVLFKGKDPIPTFEKMKKDLKSKVLRGDRGKKPKEVAFAKIEAKHSVTFNKEAQEIFKSDKVLKFPADSLQQVFLTINQTEYLQEEYLDFIKYKRLKDQLSMVDAFKEAKLKEYVIDHLEDENKKFKKTIDTYKKGLMIFELMKNHVWDAPKNEPEKVEDFYNKLKGKYAEKGDSFKAVKGYVESDYQNLIETYWLKDLRGESEIKFNKRTVKKLKKANKVKG